MFLHSFTFLIIICLHSAVAYSKCQEQGVNCGAYLTEGENLTWHRETPYVTVEPSPDKVFFDEDDELEFVCSGSQPVDGRALIWHLQGPDLGEATPPIQSYHKSLNQNRLTLLMELAYHQSKLYCAQDFTLKLTNGTVTSYGEKARSAMITLLHRGLNDLGAESQKPWVWPLEYVDDAGKDVIEFSCGTYLRKEDWLCWHIGSRSTCSMYIHEKDYEFRTLRLIWPLKVMNSGDIIRCITFYYNTVTGSNTLKPINFDENRITNADDYGPWQSPETFVDDGGSVIEFTCWAYLMEDVETLVWYQLQESTGKSVLAMVQLPKTGMGYVKNKLRKTIEPSDNGTQIYCATLKGDDVYIMGKHIPLIFERPIDWPLVKPYKFVDNHKPFMQFTCYWFLQPGQILSWYQRTAHSADKLLKIVQPVDSGAREGEYIQLTLNKTLEPTDNGSEIYCATQSVRADGSFSEVLNETKRIPLTLTRDILPMAPVLLQAVEDHGQDWERVAQATNETSTDCQNSFKALVTAAKKEEASHKRELNRTEHAFVNVEPNNTKIYFDVNTALRLTCSGNKPVDGRNYTWFRKDSGNKLTVLQGQKYDERTNLNVLEMTVDENYHLCQLVCVQGFLAYIQYGDGSWSYKVYSYGELAKSKTITLIQREECTEKQKILPTNPAEKQKILPTNPEGTLLIVTIVLGVIAFVATAVACWALCRGRPARTATTRDSIDRHDSAGGDSVRGHGRGVLGAVQGPPGKDSDHASPQGACAALEQLRSSARAPPAP